LDQEVARRRQDAVMNGGSSAIDRALNSSLEPSAAPKGKGSVPTGVDAVAYSEKGERKNKDGSVTQTYHEVTSDEKAGTTTEKDGEFTTMKDRTMVVQEKETTYFSDNSKSEVTTKSIYDAQGNLTSQTKTDNTYVDGKIVITNNTATIYNKDGSTITVTKNKGDSTEGEKKNPSYGFDGKSGSSYGYMPLPPGVNDDRGTGDIPDYIRNQINQTKPKKGGETELTDGGVTGNSADGSGPVNNAFTRTGGVMGAVAQPTRAGEYVGSSSNGTVGSAVQNGGATDSLDGSSWTGTTHQDDPADVQFGPAEQPKEQASTKKSEDSNSSVLDQISTRKSKKAE
jgi:hypothetical protein